MKKPTDEELKKRLTPEQYHVLREGGTEPPFSGKFLKHNKKGVYTCAACGQELFDSDTKFDAPPPNEGWPSFSELIKNDAVKLVDDYRHFMHRKEVVCTNCGSTLGHLFTDGPAEAGGKHYCINSCALDFKQK